jgi:ABC-type Fe3+/spermidine/putrescine transport system ATPase subunit
VPSAISVEIRGLTKRFGETSAVDSVSLDIRRGEFFSLLGPSGCGKTTLLRMIGGFEEPTAGTIRIGGADMTHTPPYRRPVNMVFQHYALFPHLSVGENVAFGLRYRGLDRAAEARRVAEVLGLVQLAGFEKRRPNQLSGGQRQRIALARALAMEPEVLLLDEPLGALDQKLRKEVQVQLKHLQRDLGITFVFVTHDQEEALTMSDRIAVMNRGKVEQADDAAVVSNFFAARVREAAGDAATLDLAAGGETRIALPPDPDRPRPGDPVRFVVRPEKLELRSAERGDPGAASVAVTVEERVYQGISTVWIVRDAAGERLTIYEQNDRTPEESSRHAVGSRGLACWNPAHAVLIRTEREDR